MSKSIKTIATLLVGLLLVNFLSNQYYKRFDLTQDQRYTLKETSKSIVNAIQLPILVKVYLQGEFPSEFKRLQIETKQFLEEFRMQLDDELASAEEFI